MISRRNFVIALGLGLQAQALSSRAQQPTRIWRVGFLGAATEAGWASRIRALRAGLRELGYVEGTNLIIEFRWAEGKYDRLPGLAAELVQLDVDVIVTHGTPGSRAAKQATTTVPIVMAVVGDPVSSGLVASLARPGGNMTGTTFFGRELAAKRFEILKEAFPRVMQVALLVNPDNSWTSIERKHIEGAARSLGVALKDFPVRGPENFDGAFESMAKQRVDAVAVSEEGMLNSNVKQIAALSTRHNLLSTGSTLFANAGGLLGYGINNPELYRRAAYFVARVLKGAKPADLPIERPTKFELIINMKTARALGTTIPRPILVRADRVIE